MHPILMSRGRLGAYLVAWAPLALLAVTLFTRFGSSFGEAVLLGLPLTVVEAYLCLAAWYLCRSLGLSRPTLWRTLAGHLAGAALTTALWLAIGWAWARFLSTFPEWSGADLRAEAALATLAAFGIPAYLASAALHYGLLAAERAAEAERSTLELALKTREAELAALQAKLDPHFLFNALNAIGALAGHDGGAARKMSILLAEFLRRTLALGTEPVPLEAELAHAAAYLAVERVRFGDRLAVSEAVEPEATRCLVPPLLLQPLVENAVRHGIAQLLEGGTIRLEARLDRAARRLHVAVENGRDPDARSVPGHGVGLGNLESRLAARYGGAAALRALAQGDRFRVEIDLPAVFVE